MSDTTQDINVFKKPRLLKEMYAQLVSELSDGGIENQKEKEIQLREISKTIDNLEKKGISIPDALRNEKSKIIRILSKYESTNESLAKTADVLEYILNDIRLRIETKYKKNSKNNTRLKLKLPKTKSNVLRENIILALKSLGGRAPIKEVLKLMENQLQGKLLPGDLEWHVYGKDRMWQYYSHWERIHMVKDGIMLKGTSHGIWELADEYR